MKRILLLSSILLTTACGPDMQWLVVERDGSSTKDNDVEEPSAGTEDGPCLADGTCNTGLVCVEEVCVAGPPPGPPTGTEGGPCFGNDTCDQGLVCVDGVCEAEPPGPEAGTEGGPCFGNGTCDSGLICVDDVCVAEPEVPDAGPEGGAEGGPCFDDGACDSGLVCVDDICQTEAPGPDEGSEGGPCFDDGTCDSGLACIDDVCVSEPPPPPVGDEGQPCFDDGTCNGDLSCIADVCVGVPPSIGHFLGPQSVEYGEEARIYWGSTGADFCEIDPGDIAVSPTGELFVEPEPPETTYTLTCTNAYGTDEAFKTVSIVGPAIYTTSDGSADLGGSADITWSAPDAVSCEFDQGIGLVANSGTVQVQPEPPSTTYTLTCTDDVGAVSTQLFIVEVNPPSVDFFTATPAHIAAGESSTLEWASVSAEACSIDGGIGDVALTGQLVVSPAVTTTYYLTCTSVVGSIATGLTVYVN